MSDADERIIHEFLVDSLDGLDRLDRTLVELEQDPHSGPLLAEAFRTLHNIKGTCSFLGYGRLERVAHAGESLMSRLRSGERVIDPEVTSALLGIADAARSILANIQSSRGEGAGDDTAVIARVEALIACGEPTRPRRAVRRRPAAAGPPTVSAPTDASEPARAAGPRGPAPPTTPTDTGGGESAQAAHPMVGAGHLRVEVGRLDQLMNLVGELVLARNQLLQRVGQERWSAIPQVAQHLDHVTSRLQEEVMRTRMQPIATLFGRLPRLVRDVATECGKEVALQTDGGGTELDKTLLDALKDPLVHLVRNAIDHGIETPERRRTAGKSPEGRLRVAAHHEGGYVHLEVLDDGQGISLERIRRAAIERRLVTAEEAPKLTDQSLLKLIFEPGFSTAERVTAISGRGVGMDVVRAAIERIGGTIEVQSRAGAGTTFRVRIPLTLAIIPALMVEQHGMRFAIPQIHVLELVRLDPRGPARIEFVHGAPVFRLRARLLPLLMLGEQLGLPAEKERETRADRLLAVVEADGRQLGIVFEGVHDTEEIVVKPLSDGLRAIGVYAGATILGDGRAALILDVPGLARRAGLTPLGDVDPPEVPTPEAEQELLLIRLREGWPVAVDASHVSRIEVFAGHAIESPDRSPAVRWRGQVLPVVSLASALSSEPFPIEMDRDYHVLVHTRGPRPLGVLVDQVEDIVRVPVDLEPEHAPGPLLGRVVVRERITDLVDLDRVVAPLALAQGRS